MTIKVRFNSRRNPKQTTHRNINDNNLTLTWCPQLSSKKWALPFSLLSCFDHGPLPIFKCCDIWENTIPLCSPIIVRKGYWEITGPTLPTCSTPHPVSPRNDSDQKIGIQLSQSAHRTVTMGTPYLVIILPFILEDVDFGYSRGQCAIRLDHVLSFLRDERTERNWGKRRKNYWKMTEKVVYLPQSSISTRASCRGRGQIDLGNKG